MRTGACIARARLVHSLRMAVVVTLVVAAGAGCTTFKKKKLETEYGPTESVVEVVAVLRALRTVRSGWDRPRCGPERWSPYLGAIARGADIVRVHDVKEMARVARMTDAIVR